jgi:D-arabinose 1-dehydrogenase-like Zn-dependent alcohol dehydrogenase
LEIKYQFFPFICLSIFPSYIATMSLPETMQAIQIKEFNAPYAVSKVAVPKPKPNQLLIRIKAAGFCHTDLMALNNEFNSPLPYIGSHEGAGVVEEVGSNVQGFAKGDHVGCINFDSSCGKSKSIRLWAGGTAI